MSGLIPLRQAFSPENGDRKIGTGSPAGKLILHLFASLAEFERDLIRERTLAALS
jgi:DNA invertase Pin-like site-specific DNA recombinase